MGRTLGDKLLPDRDSGGAPPMSQNGERVPVQRSVRKRGSRQWRSGVDVCARFRFVESNLIDSWAKRTYYSLLERRDARIMELDRTSSCNRNIVLAFSCIQRGAKTTFKVDMLCITRAGGSSRKRKVGEEDAKDSRYTWTREKGTAYLRKRVGFYPMEIPFCCLI